MDTESPCLADVLSQLLDSLGAQRLVDFSAYTPSLLKRRVQLRVAACEQPDLAAYQEYLRSHPEELRQLIDTLAITVSHFFRNILTFALLRERIVPALFAGANPQAGIRVWCAGCAQGEEAYSIAILLRDYCRREGLSVPILILATDIDREALAWAARGWYRPQAMDEIRKAYLDRYFIADGEGYRVSDEIISMVTFGWHDLTSDNAPQQGIFSDYQLILCRNVLIYFRQQRSALIQQRLADQLLPGGWLVLGEAETISPALGRQLREVMAGAHIFQKGD